MGKEDGVMLFQESETVEFKEAVIDEIKKDAFKIILLRINHKFCCHD